MNIIIVYRCTKILLALFLSVLLTLPIYASVNNYTGIKNNKEKSRFPRGCNEHGYHFKNSVLFLNGAEHGNQQSIYFIHNLSKKKIKLHQMQSGEEAYIAHKNNSINPNHWGVFAMNEQQIRFFCTINNRKYPKGEIIDCKDKLDICEFTNVRFGTNIQGNYWPIFSKAGMKSTHKLGIDKGFLLK